MKSKIDLSGMWEFCLDGDKKGMEQEFYNRHFRTRSHCRERPRRQKRAGGERKER